MRNRNYNFYEVLGVERGCTNEQIKAAYLKLAKQYHPDVNKDVGSDDKFKSITVAYEALSNERNRDLYDAYMDSDPYSQEWKYKEEHYREYDRGTRERARGGEDKGNSYYRHHTDSNFWQGNRKQYEEEVNKDYENIFSQGYKQAKPQKGEDIKLEITISLFESFKGVNKVISYLILRVLNLIEKRRVIPATENAAHLEQDHSSALIAEELGILKVTTKLI
jgi:DnaJ-class molecular chaperone